MTKCLELLPQEPIRPRNFTSGRQLRTGHFLSLWRKSTIRTLVIEVRNALNAARVSVGKAVWRRDWSFLCQPASCLWCAISVGFGVESVHSYRCCENLLFFFWTVLRGFSFTLRGHTFKEELVLQLMKVRCCHPACWHASQPAAKEGGKL